MGARERRAISLPRQLPKEETLELVLVGWVKFTKKGIQGKRCCVSIKDRRARGIESLEWRKVRGDWDLRRAGASLWGYDFQGVCRRWHEPLCAWERWHARQCARRCRLFGLDPGKRVEWFMLLPFLPGFLHSFCFPLTKGLYVILPPPHSKPRSCACLYQVRRGDAMCPL